MKNFCSRSSNGGDSPSTSRPLSGAHPSDLSSCQVSSSLSSFTSHLVCVLCAAVNVPSGQSGAVELPACSLSIKAHGRAGGSQQRALPLKLSLLSVVLNACFVVPLSSADLKQPAAHLNVSNSDVAHNGSLKGCSAPQRGSGVPQP